MRCGGLQLLGTASNAVVRSISTRTRCHSSSPARGRRDSATPAVAPGRWAGSRPTPTRPRFMPSTSSPTTRRPGSAFSSRTTTPARLSHGLAQGAGARRREAAGGLAGYEITDPTVDSQVAQAQGVGRLGVLLQGIAKVCAGPSARRPISAGRGALSSNPSRRSPRRSSRLASRSARA